MTFRLPNPRLTTRAVTVLAVLAAVAMFALAPGGGSVANAQEGVPASEEPCSGSGSAPVPTEVAVSAVPIVVESTTTEYFVLYVKHDLDGTEVALPVLVKLGETGTTTLAENVAPLPVERYRVEKHLVA